MSDTLSAERSTTDKVLLGVVIADTAFIGLLAWQFYSTKNSLESRIDKLEKNDKLHKKAISDMRTKTQQDTKKSNNIKVTLQAQEDRIREVEDKLESLDNYGETIAEIEGKLDHIQVQLDGDEPVKPKPKSKPNAKVIKNSKPKPKPKPKPVITETPTEEEEEDIYDGFDD